MNKTQTYTTTQPLTEFQIAFEHVCNTAKPGSSDEAFAHCHGESPFYIHADGASYVFRVADDYVAFTKATACQYCEEEGEACEHCNGTLVQYADEGTLYTDTVEGMLEVLELLAGLAVGAEAREAVCAALRVLPQEAA